MRTTAALHGVLALAEAGSEQAVLEVLVDLAVRLCGAEHGVALLLGAEASVTALAHVGMPGGHTEKMPHLPRPIGLIGHVLGGRTVRTEDLRAHPAAVGTPFGHFAMKALLGVPISARGRVLGGLWLTKGPQEPAFSAEDEERAEALARHAALVVAALRRREADQALLAHLGQPHPPGQESAHAPGASAAVRQLVHRARQVVGAEVVFLGRIQGGEQVYTVVDSATGAPLLAPVTGARGGASDVAHAAREVAGAPGVPPGTEVPRIREGASTDAEQSYCSRLLSGQLPAVVPDTAVHPLTSTLAITTEAGIGAYCGVPVLLPDGTAWGTLCGVNGRAGQAWSAPQVQALRTIATLIGRSVHDSQALAAQRSGELSAFQDLIDGSRRRTVVQPIIELSSGATCGFEALSRFSESTGASYRPDLAFADAARLGVVLALEHAALLSALALVPTLPADTYLSVNLSPRTIVHPGTYDLFRGHRLERVVVEMTEHEQVQDYPAVLNALQALRSRGARLAIDDTGAGFAGLQHLARLRPDIVKLDVSFVRGIDRDASLRAVARAVASFAAEVGAALVAEGIETAAELAQLRALGATHGQGYLLGRPVAPGAVFGTSSASSAARASGR
ncbi:EAL domain-containing protein [Kineococcus sp. SYSU DK005]|uniref:EAL domain-containing protein n=1 Tax=Kineococcus sp. SYSU DK005 TaxID=3383126 RepID=UPI003D7CE153